MGAGDIMILFGHASPLVSLCYRNWINPLSPNSDQLQISPCNINAYSTTEVMRIKDNHYGLPSTFIREVWGTRKENLFSNIWG